MECDCDFFNLSLKKNVMGITIVNKTKFMVISEEGIQLYNNINNANNLELISILKMPIKD